MTKTYKIEVDCANCANLCEIAVNKITSVKNATVNFMMQKMVVEFEEGADIASVCKAIVKACRKIEPDFEMEL